MNNSLQIRWFHNRCIPVLVTIFLLFGILSTFIFPSLSLAMTIPSPNQNNSIRHISLAGTWQYLSGYLNPANMYSSKQTNQHWQPMTIPSNWYLEGLDTSGDVWLKRTFTIEAESFGSIVRLIFEGIDYTADVWINGTHVGFHEGSFQPFSFRIDEHLRFGKENTLMVRVNSPLEQPGQSWSLHKRLIKGIFGHHDTRPGGAWSDRGQEKNTGGIWGDVYLKLSTDLAIDTIQTTPRVNFSGYEHEAHIDLEISTDKNNLQDIELRTVLSPANFPHDSTQTIMKTQFVSLRSEPNHIQMDIPMPEAQLWWPWEMGTPHLYTVTVSAIRNDEVLDSSEITFGMRDIRLDPNTHQWIINGKRIFLRGTNYISSQWLSEMSAERYAYDIALMKRANINAVRVHAHVERSEFYRQCDRAGLLVWQDFPLQWGYVDDEDFIQEAAHQAIDMATMLYNHPAIIAWSGHNEPPWSAEWMKWKYPDYDPEQNTTLDKVIWKALQRADSTRHVHLASTTEEHPWFGWYSGSWKDYGKPTPVHMITEFGAQALPGKSFLRKMFTEEELWPDSPSDWEKWAYHNFQQKETFELAHVAMGENIDEFIQNTQTYQAKLIQYAAESYRRQRFQPVTSIFQFMFVENWPSINWGIVDYERNPKRAYDALRVAYQPILPSIAWTQDTWTTEEEISFDFWVINDLLQSFPSAQLTYSLRTKETILETKNFPLFIQPDNAVKVGTFHQEELPADQYELIVTLKDVNASILGQNALAFSVIPISSNSLHDKENDRTTTSSTPNPTRHNDSQWSWFWSP